MRKFKKILASVFALSTWLLSSVAFAYAPPTTDATSSSVPELDPSMAASALALLAAAALVVYGARKRS